MQLKSDDPIHCLLARIVRDIHGLVPFTNSCRYCL
jgi:hypothetical protein